MIEKVTEACKWGPKFQSKNQEFILWKHFIQCGAIESFEYKSNMIKGYFRKFIWLLEEEVRELKIIKGVLSQGVDVMHALQHWGDQILYNPGEIRKSKIHRQLWQGVRSEKQGHLFTERFIHSSGG